MPAGKVEKAIVAAAGSILGLLSAIFLLFMSQRSAKINTKQAWLAQEFVQSRRLSIASQEWVSEAERIFDIADAVSILYVMLESISSCLPIIKLMDLRGKLNL